MSSEWVKVAAYATGYEADAARAILEEAGIPVLLKGNQPGIFGVGFQGPIVGGVHIQVPLAAADQARELLGEITDPDDHDVVTDDDEYRE
jgi:hypothetical protein